MKKIKIFPVVLFAILAIYSCEEGDVSVNAEFKTQYSLNCVLSGMHDTQYVSILQSYPLADDGITPAIDDPFVKGAEVKIWYKDQVLFFNQAKRARDESSVFEDSLTYYYRAGFKPEFGAEVKIEALLLNGRRLTALTKIPDKITSNLADLEDDDPAREIPGEYSEEVKLTWTSTISGLYYHPRIFIVYWKNDGWGDKRYTYEAPLFYTELEGEFVPNYATPTIGGGITFRLDAFSRAMTLLSESDPNKTDYRIMYASIDIIIFDSHLSAYYASTGREADEFSIKLQELDYTNVQNGYGIFGSYITQSIGMGIDPEYIRSFGYVPFFDDSD